MVAGSLKCDLWFKIEFKTVQHGRLFGDSNPFVFVIWRKPIRCKFRWRDNDVCEEGAAKLQCESMRVGQDTKPNGGN